MSKLTKEKKIKIGLLCNKICTAAFILFVINVCVVITFDFNLFLILTVVLVVMFSASCVTAHICLKDYKPQ